DPVEPEANGVAEVVDLFRPKPKRIAVAADTSIHFRVEGGRGSKEEDVLGMVSEVVEADTLADPLEPRSAHIGRHFTDQQDRGENGGCARRVHGVAPATSEYRLPPKV